MCAYAFLTAVVFFWGLKISTLILLLSIEMLMLFWDCMIFAESDENWLTSRLIILNICGFDKVKRSFVFYKEVSCFDFWQLSLPLRLFRRKYEAFVSTLMLSMLYIMQLLIILCKWRLTSDKQKNSTELYWLCLFFFFSSSEVFFTSLLLSWEFTKTPAMLQRSKLASMLLCLKLGKVKIHFTGRQHCWWGIPCWRHEECRVTLSVWESEWT